MMKRTFDVFMAVVLGVVIFPLLIVLMICIKLDSAGPAVFVQSRVGRNGHSFKCYKLRSMHVGTPQVLTHQAQTCAITRIGQLLRRTKLDELTQLYNVLVGDMSLVGARPGLVADHNLTALRRARGVLDPSSRS